MTCKRNQTAIVCGVRLVGKFCAECGISTQHYESHCLNCDPRAFWLSLIELPGGNREWLDARGPIKITGAED